jgi:type I restriction enzyme M protein
MTMTFEKTEDAPKTSSQRLDSIVKSARKIMRTDKGLNGELDRLPMLSWIMFLKFLDDLERIQEDEAILAGRKFVPAIEAPYRWRDWAAVKAGLTGPDLIRFLAAEEVVLPNEIKGAGLFTYLRGLRGRNGGRDRRDVIATVFRGLSNRMESGYLLRDVINLVDGIHFNSSEEIHTLSRLYEGLLREMRDAAGDSGEFYTPRAVVRLMVELVDPKLGEIVLDPACGTGGFLAETYSHLEKQAGTVEQRKLLQAKAPKGVEPKSLPYMLAEMNLLLHGLEAPDIDPGNALRFRLGEIGERERVDVILTNPPFGGEEEKGIQSNFPEDRQTGETALLFLQLIMRKLRRNVKVGYPPARAAVIVPNGTLYEEGVAQRIREDLIRNLNLHTVVRLPKGVFEPYTDIATNILFFDCSGSSKDVWFYEHPLPPRRAHLKGKSYSASDGLRSEEFDELRRWWTKREQSEQAWKVSVPELAATGFDLAIDHPKHAKVILPPPNEIISTVRILKDESEVILRKLEQSLAQLANMSSPAVPLSELLRQRQQTISVADNVEYARPRVQLHFRGARVRDRVLGSEIGTKNQTIIHTNDLIVSKIDARNGAMALVPGELDGAIATNDFPTFEIDTARVLPAYLRYCLFQPQMLRVYERLSRGSTNRRRLQVEKFTGLRVPLPPSIDTQLEISEALGSVENSISELRERFGGMEEELSGLVGSVLHRTFGGE